MTAGSSFSQVRTAGSFGQVRAADRDRDATVGVLQAAYAEGRLTRDEHDLRAGQALTAQTYGQLAALTADLPVRGGQPAGPARTSPLAIAALICGVAELPTAGLTAIPAVILGHAARRQIRRTGEAGAHLATIGLALGYAVVVPVTLLIVVVTLLVLHLL